MPYSVRIPRDLLEEMKRHYDRMEPPKPTFSAILSHLVKLGWEFYRTRVGLEAASQRVLPAISTGFNVKRLTNKT